MVNEEEFYRRFCVEPILTMFKLQSLVKIQSENLNCFRALQTIIVNLATGCSSMGSLCMVFIGLIYHNTNGTCLMKVEKLGYE